MAARFSASARACVPAAAFSWSAASGAVLLSSDNGTFRVTVYRGDSDDAMFTIRRGFVGGKPTRIEENNKETGVLLSLDPTSSYPPVCR